MPLFPSDFKKFKYKHHDEDSVTLVHPKGHEFRIARKALKGDLKQQLDAMCQGGPVKMSDGGDVEKSLNEAGAKIKKATGVTPVQQEGTSAEPSLKSSSGDVRTSEQKQKAAHHYDVPQTHTPHAPSNQPDSEGYKKMAEGGEATNEAPTMQELDPAIARKRELYNQTVMQNQPNIPFEERKMMPKIDTTPVLFGPNGEEPQQFDVKSWNAAEQQFQHEKASNAAQVADTQQRVINQNSARVEAGLQPLPVPDVPNGPQPPGSETNPVTAQPPGSPPSQADMQAAGASNGMASTMQDMEGMLKSGYESRLSGIQQQAGAQAELGKQQADVLAKVQQSQETAKAAYQQHYNELETERQALQHDVQEGHVDPEKFWTGDKNGNGGHSKILAGIGMILAGFNPTNSPNAAINFLKFQMEQNLEAQRQNLASKQNLLASNLRQFGNLRDATEFTRIQQSDIMQNQLQQAAAKASSPLAKAAALQAAGQLKMETAPMFQQFAMRRALMNISQNGGDPNAVDHMLGYMRVVNPEMAKEMESRYIPHVGMASVPVPQDVRDKITAHENMAANIKDLQRFVDTHSTIVPGTPDYNVGQQKALVLQSAVREGQLGTVYREGEQPLLDKFVNSNPAGALKMLKTVPQLRELLKSNERANNVLKKNYGLPQSQPEPEIKVINGVRYMRGPDGKAVKVK